MDVLLLPSADIDECADGFVECDSKSTCVNLPGWYHCECRDGYHDNGLFSTNGESCVGEWPTFALYGTRNMVGKFRIAPWILKAPEHSISHLHNINHLFIHKNVSIWLCAVKGRYQPETNLNLKEIDPVIKY